MVLLSIVYCCLLVIRRNPFRSFFSFEFEKDMSDRFCRTMHIFKTFLHRVFLDHFWQEISLTFFFFNEWFGETYSVGTNWILIVSFVTSWRWWATVAFKCVDPRLHDLEYVCVCFILSCIIFDLCIYYRETNIVGIVLRRRSCRNAFVCLLRQIFHFVFDLIVYAIHCWFVCDDTLSPMLFAKTFFFPFLSVHYSLLCWVCRRPCSVVELEWYVDGIILGCCIAWVLFLS